MPVHFDLVSPFQPAGDQPAAIEKLAGFAEDALDLELRTMRLQMRLRGNDPAQIYWMALVTKHHLRCEKTRAFQWVFEE